jgi:hypothetical protein
LGTLAQWRFPSVNDGRHPTTSRFACQQIGERLSAGGNSIFERFAGSSSPRQASSSRFAARDGSNADRRRRPHHHTL